MGHATQRILPKRIILLRHAESWGNLDKAAYETIPDNKIPLTNQGKSQARLAGKKLKAIVSSSSSVYSDDNDDDNGADNHHEWRVYFYVSPYERSRSTLREIGKSFSRKRVIGVREECRIREQDFGNFQVEERMKMVKDQRQRFGRFFYRFPEGESSADVYDRVSSFLESLWRDIEMHRLHHDPSHLNLIIVSHGLTSRVFLMKWFKWTVEQFEQLYNPDNCDIRVMQLAPGGEYSLAIHHTEEEMREWGLSQEMIDDQKCRATASRGSSNEHNLRYLEGFFDSLADSDSEMEKHED